MTIRFEPNSRLEIEHFTGEFAANGAVRALGTKERPVVFTSGAAMPQPGDWGGLWFGGIARGWRGTAGPDFLTGIAYEDASGCKQTRPQIDGQPCPSPAPSCPE